MKRILLLSLILLPAYSFSAMKAWSGKVSEAHSYAEAFLLEKYPLAKSDGAIGASKINPAFRGELINYTESMLALTGLSQPEPTGTTLRIEKSAYRLLLLREGEVIKGYPCVFGFNSVDDKRMEGDGCTPEGQFSLRAIYPHDFWTRFMWVDYPTTDSYAKHAAAKAAGEIPQTASIGGEIGIHGVPDGTDWAIDSLNNWTLGCISLKNKDIRELYDWCQEGTLVEIVP